MPASSRIRRGRKGTHPDARPRCLAERKDRARPAHDHRSLRLPLVGFSCPGAVRGVTDNIGPPPRGSPDSNAASRGPAGTRTATPTTSWRPSWPPAPDSACASRTLNLGDALIAELRALPRRISIHALEYSLAISPLYGSPL